MKNKHLFFGFPKNSSSPFNRGEGWNLDLYVVPAGWEFPQKGSEFCKGIRAPKWPSPELPRLGVNWGSHLSWN